jgi:hypothetical protein
MTVIRPNSVSGITSITAQADEINFFRSNGTLAGLQLNGVNFNTTTGVSTFNNLDVGGVLTYQDVTNVDSVGIITARSTIDAQGDVSIADKIIHTGDTNTAIRFPAADTITAETAGNERLRITSDGDILTSGNTQLFGSNTSDGSDNKAIMINGGGAVSDSRGGYLLVHGNEHSSNAGIIRLHAGNVGTAYIAFNTSGNERLRITSTGEVNIGGNFSETSHPLNISHSTKPSLALHTGTTLRADFSATTGITSIRSHANSPFTINIGGSGETEAFRIDANGDINLGNNPTNQYGYKLNIQDSAVIYAQTASSGGLEAKWHLDNSAQLMTFGTVSTDDLSFVTTNVERLRISSGGGHKITCNVPYYAANLTECNTGSLAFNINQTRSGQTKGIAFGAIGNGTTRTGIQCYDTSDNSANTLLLNPLGGRVAINISGEPSATFEVGSSIGGDYSHTKHGWAQKRYFSVTINTSEHRWYKMVNYAAGAMLIGEFVFFSSRNGGFNQTKGFHTWRVSYNGYNNNIYGTSGSDSGSLSTGTAAGVNITAGGSPQNVYMEIPDSIYGGRVYGYFEGVINNWQFDEGTYLTSAP